MRLLNIESLTFQEFYDEDIPPYFILSHRWGGNEVSFKEFTKHKIQDGAGYRKIIQFCEFTKRFNAQSRLKTDRVAMNERRLTAEWVWIDTCCIDKRSSAELSEAVNSMYRWYCNAQVCVAFLADVPNGQDDAASGWSNLRKSAWFTRGWTLQELLAPHVILFCDTNWEVFGHLYQVSSRPRGWYIRDIHGIALFGEISEITGIPQMCLTDHVRISTMSTAQKMSWASKRKTSRIEDEAYCLLGLFHVNMPLLYGEGRAAFYRLQQEIIKDSADLSIFAWMSPSAKSPTPRIRLNRAFRYRQAPLFATCPAAFADCENTLRLTGHFKTAVRALPFAMTNLGLELHARLFPVSVSNMEDYDIFLIKLPVDHGDGVTLRSYYVVALIRLAEPYGEYRFARLHMGDLDSADNKKDVESIERVVYIDTGRGRWDDLSPVLAVRDSLAQKAQQPTIPRTMGGR